MENFSTVSIVQTTEPTTYDSLHDGAICMMTMYPDQIVKAFALIHESPCCFIYRISSKMNRASKINRFEARPKKKLTRNSGFV